MQVAALYDIHGNLPALEAVLRDVLREAVDAIVVGGDIVPGPMAAEALTLLLEQPIPVHFIRGNGERETLGVREGKEPTVPLSAVDSVRWSAGQLSEDQAEVMRGWPATVQMEIAGLGEVLFCHATPDSDSEIFTRATPVRAVVGVFREVKADVVVCGHTHMQFDRMIGRVRVANAGSVGMPFGKAGAYWVLLGADVWQRCTEYDLNAAAERIRRSTYPAAEEFASRNVLQPPLEEEMVALFERAATGRSGA
jgi:predicted phosphodiesterase